MIYFNNLCVCVCFLLFHLQTVLEFGPGQRECNASQQPGEVCVTLYPRKRLQPVALGWFLCRVSSSFPSVYAHRFAYKDEYEKFKLYMTIILMFGAITCLFFLNCRWANSGPKARLLLLRFYYGVAPYWMFSALFRVTDEIFNFLLVWYFCTLTIRESILISNGSRCVVASENLFLMVYFF